MSEVRAASLLALWGAAHRVGAVSADSVLDQLATAGRQAGVRADDAATAERTSIPGPGEAGAGTLALLQLFRSSGPPQLLLPVAGDVRGLPPRCRALVPALDAGAAVLLPESQLAIIPSLGHWRVHSTPGSDTSAEQLRWPELFDIERELDSAIRSATSQLLQLDVARGADGVHDRIAEAMRSSAIEMPPIPGRAAVHCRALLAKVVSLEALLSVAVHHETRAVSRHELAVVDGALRPLASAVRMGRLTAVNTAITEMGSRPRSGVPVSRKSNRLRGIRGGQTWE
jgi:hypothetical protein